MSYNLILNVVRSLLLAAGLVGAAAATAQGAYPNKPIKLIVPFPPGSGPDVLSRIFAQWLPESLSQPIVIENRVGAAGIIGVGIVAKAVPDGYTLLLGTLGTHVLNAALYSKLPYDAVKDFAPISQVALMPHVVVLHPSVPANSMKEFVTFARARPAQLNYASAGIGTGMHLAAVLMISMTKIDLVHVPYKGPAESMTAVLTGDVALTIPVMLAALPSIKAGRVRVLAVTSPQRSPMLPDTPTMAEAGFPGYDFSNWYGLFAPAGTPPQIIHKLNQEVVRVLSRADVAKALMQQGVIVVGNTPKQFTSNIGVDIARWTKVVNDAKLQIE